MMVGWCGGGVGWCVVLWWAEQGRVAVGCSVLRQEKALSTWVSGTVDGYRKHTLLP